ncbi:mitochondrial metalloendopeptidase OMA1-like [Neltuma alba]|uniref:mitochondrial metalloendopeptidase OMA1-like n=1 Tax=Neltuma alba TaxID=207710 RepID=UPI0010A505C0|nr:mitochondrial metalloendopeptidase OMA1-like [Prosopis alba]
MGSRVRSGKLVFDSFRSCSSRFMPNAQILITNKRISQFEQLLVPAWNRAKFHIRTPSYHSLVSQRANKNLLSDPFLNEARRFYYVDQYNNVQQQHIIYYDHLEIVPYHKRTRLILFSESTLKKIREQYVKKKKERFEERVLPQTQAESIRVRRIAQDIIDAYEDEINRQGSQFSATSHLDGLKKWEVLVVSGHGNSAFTAIASSGKIVVFDWMFEHATSDVEMAFLIGREIGHIVARHTAENLTRAYGFKILESILNPIGLWDAFKDHFAKRTINMRIFWM